VWSKTRWSVVSSVICLYVNSIILELNKSGYGCHIGSIFVGCVMYADYLLLLSASLHDLQRMIDICCREAVQLDMAFNANKSQAIRVGRVYGKEINPITVNCVAIRI